ncbi:MAG: ABC transporter permease [Armatimonadota bacterium]|nr:ABC transporter permease [Armatimonadota bacterium]
MSRVVVALAALAGAAALILLRGVAATASLALMALAAMVPIALPAIGEVVNQKGGVFNIGLEGIMLIASVAAVYAAELGGSGLVGLGGGLLSGAAVALLFGLAVTYGRANQTIAGLGLNFFGIGAVAFLIFEIWGAPGFHRVPEALRIPPLATPAGLLRWLSVVTVLMPIMVVGLLQHVPFGLRLRAVGHNALVSDVSGIEVHRLRLAACVLGGALAGLGGAYMSLDWIGLASIDLIAGRGFVALACVVFSGLNPWRAVAAAFVFSVFNALGLWLQVEPWARPLMAHGGSALFLMLPYASVLILLVAAPARDAFPREIGRPYERP